MGEIERILEWAFGTGGSSVHINVAQMSLRAAVVYGATVLIVRMGKKRFMSQATAFDVILSIMLGSMVSRAIAGTAPFLPTLARRRPWSSCTGCSRPPRRAGTRSAKRLPKFRLPHTARSVRADPETTVPSS